MTPGQLGIKLLAQILVHLDQAGFCTVFDLPKNYENHSNLCWILPVADRNFEQD